MSSDLPARLSRDDIQKIYDWADALPEVAAVRLFGSYAKGIATDASDVDLAVSLVVADNDTAFAFLIEKASQWNGELSAALRKDVRIEEYPGQVGHCCVEASVLIYP